MKAAIPLWWHLLAVPAAAAGAAVVLLFVWAFMVGFSYEHVGGTRQAPSRLSPVRATPPQVSISRTRSRPALYTAAGERSAEERLATSADLLDFVESIRRRPVPGGHYLALKAYDFCTREARLTLDAMMGANEDVHTAVVADGRQLDAQARLARLCGTFRQRNSGNLAGLDYYLLVEEGLQAQDSRLMLARRLERLSAQWDTTSRDDSPSRQNLITDVLTGGDGWLIRDLAGEFEVILHTGQLMIGGQAVDSSESADVIQALWIMACENGAACARDGEWQQLLACASAAECAPEPAFAHGNALRWRSRIREVLLAGTGGIDVVPLAEQRF